MWLCVSYQLDSLNSRCCPPGIPSLLCSGCPSVSCCLPSEGQTEEMPLWVWGARSTPEIPLGKKRDNSQHVKTEWVLVCSLSFVAETIHLFALQNGCSEKKLRLQLWNLNTGFLRLNPFEFWTVCWDKTRHLNMSTSAWNNSSIPNFNTRVIV